jgi:hypothetical protein
VVATIASQIIIVYNFIFVSIIIFSKMMIDYFLKNRIIHQNK